MYKNFETLQSQCKKYYLMRFLKMALPLLLLFVVAFALWFYQKSSTTKIVKKPVVKKVIVQQKRVKKIPPKVKKEIKKAPVAPKPKIEQKSVVAPKKVVVKKDVEYSIDANYHYVPHRVAPKEEKKRAIKQTLKKEPVAPKKRVEEKVTKPQEEKALHLSLKNINSIDAMLQIFHKRPSYDLAIKIAEKYYESQKYDASKRWSKKANMLNKKDVASWILYAKSEYALGRHKRAKEILRLYLANKKSTDASMVLNSWEKGE